LRGLHAAGVQQAVVSLAGQIVAPPAYKTAAHSRDRASPHLLTSARLAGATAHLQALDARGQRYKAPSIFPQRCSPSSRT